MTGFRERYGQTALVTGASSGIGDAFAHELAARGLDLILVARRVDRLEALARSLEAAHSVSVTCCDVDLARADAADIVADRAASHDVGLVVSNAGFAIKGDHAEADPAAMSEMLMVNCHTPLQLTRAFIPRLRKRGRGGIILTSSVEGLIGCPYSAAYSSSKALVKALGEALWGELHPEGIDVLTLCPGATESEAAARSGIDPATIPHMMKAGDVATLALDRLSDGPTLIGSEYYGQLFDGLLAMPRRDALAAMATAVRPVAPGADAA